MHEVLTKTRFINALVREHVAIHEGRKSAGVDTADEYLRLDTELSKDSQQVQLVIRGNRVGTHWMILENGFLNTPKGTRLLYKLAIDIAHTAAEKASKQIGEPVGIGMPRVRYFEPWFKATA
jgi:hypothetical protein